MSLPWLAGIWLVAGVAAGLFGRGPHSRRAAALISLAVLAVACALTERVGATPHPLSGASPALSREGAGLLTASAVALWLCLLLADRVEGREVLMLGAAGGAVALLLGAGSPLLLGVAALLAVAALTLRWLAVAPGRAGLAAGRVAGTGAAALLAASVFLPVTAPGSTGAPAVGMAAGLIAAGVVALAGLVPLGGWVAGAMGVLAPTDAAGWLVLVVPATLVASGALTGALPLVGRLAVEHTLLTCGLISAVWAGLQAIRARSGARISAGDDPAAGRRRAAPQYRRLALGDVALVAVGIGTGQAVGITGGLLIILTHLVVAPLLLQPPRGGVGWPRRLLWLALSGVPPAPSFWGRVLVLRACAGFGGSATLFCLIALGLLTLASLLAITRADPPTGDRAPLPQVVAAWGLAGAAVAVAVAPMTLMHMVFGGGA